MTNNGKFFTFLFSQSSKSQIYIRRIEISRKFLRNGLLCLALIIGFSAVGLGIFGVYNKTISIDSNIASGLVNPALSQLSLNPNSINSIDYSRPDSSSDLTLNSGGPAFADSMDAENVEIEKQLRLIQTTSNPAFIPTIWAHMGKINNEFGFRRNPFGGRTYEFHAGMDIDGERGDIVVAPANGVVTEAGWKGGYGQMIEVDHGNGLKTRYGHLSKIEVEIGTPITRGQLMAYIGSTGRSTGPHLHYELRLNDKPINPRRFLPPEATELRKLNG